MVLATTSERGTSGSPATAGLGVRWLVPVIAVAFAGAALVVSTRSDHASRTAAPAPAVAASTTDEIKQLEARTAAAPTDVPAWQQLSRLYLQHAIRSGDPAYYDLTQRAIETSRRLSPDDHTTVVTDGALALSLHDFARAHGLGEQAHQQVPEDPDPLAILVDASVELGRYDEAETHLTELLGRRPGSAALARLFYLRELHGDLEGARLAMLQAEADAGAPGDRATIATFIGDQRLAERDLAGAAAAYDRARQASPGVINTEVGLARLKAAEGQLGDAIETLAGLVDRTPTPAAATLLGELQQAAGRDTDAAASFDLARAGTQLLIAAGSTVDLESAVFTADHGDPATAVTLATRAYDARHTVFAADALGWALTRAGRPAEALPYVEEALRLGTRSPGLHAHAALAFAATGQDAPAAAELATAFTSSAWLVPSLRVDASALADRLHVAVPPDWRP
jgi:tetratricopeptide (TPR) repeat protein